MEQTFFLKVADFFRLERGKMVNYIRTRLADGSERDAEDIMQDVMLKVFDMADINQPIEKLSSYIYTALRNRIIDVFRTRKQQLSFDELDEATEFRLESVLNDAPHANTSLEQKEYYEEIYRAIDMLNDDERAVVIATEFEDIPFRELAEEWDVPVGTLLSRKKRALDKIKDILIKGGVER